jgi:hypothetical protein
LPKTSPVVGRGGLVYPFRYMVGRWPPTDLTLSTSTGVRVGYVDRILKGAKAADLRMQQLSTKFELAINLKTAKTWPHRVPPSSLVTARVIRSRSQHGVRVGGRCYA